MILFDIDGTLTRTQNGYLPFNEAILQTFGIAGDIRTVVPDGNTDPLIVKDIFVKAQVSMAIDDDDWTRFPANLQSCYERHVQQGSTTVRALPGALGLLRALAEHNGLGISVVTGNLEVAAQVKLQAAGLFPDLSRGADASDSAYRQDLPAIAKDRWEQLVGRTVRCGDCVVIGDTPKDLAAAWDNDMRTCRPWALSGRRACVLATGRLSGGSMRYPGGADDTYKLVTIAGGQSCNIEPSEKRV